MDIQLDPRLTPPASDRQALWPVLLAAVMALPAAIMLVGWAFHDLPNLGLAWFAPALMLWMALVLFATHSAARSSIVPVLLSTNALCALLWLQV